MNYYKRHIGDYAAATRHLSILEHGVYMLMIDTYYTNECAFPADIKQAARKIGARSDDEIQAVENILNDFFILESDGWHQKRCDEELEAYKAKAETNRVTGAKGGRPKKQTESIVEENPEITQTVILHNPQITLTSNQEPITNNQEPILREESASAPTPPTKKSAIAKPDVAEKPETVSDELWAEWLTIRKAKKQMAPTARAMQAMNDEASKAGIGIVQAITECCDRGWAGFKADWYENSRAAMPTNQRQPPIFDQHGGSVIQMRPQQPQSKMMQGVAALQAMKSTNRGAQS